MLQTTWSDKAVYLQLIKGNRGNVKRVIQTVKNRELRALAEACEAEVRYVYSMEGISSAHAQRLQECCSKFMQMEDQVPLNSALTTQQKTLEAALIAYEKSRSFSAQVLLARRFAEHGNVYAAAELAKGVTGGRIDVLWETMGLQDVRPQEQTQCAQEKAAIAHGYQLVPFDEGQETRVAVKEAALAILWKDGTRQDVDLLDRGLTEKLLPDPTKPIQVATEDHMVVLHFTDRRGRNSIEADNAVRPTR